MVTEARIINLFVVGLLISVAYASEYFAVAEKYDPAPYAVRSKKFKEIRQHYISTNIIKSIGIILKILVIHTTESNPDYPVFRLIILARIISKKWFALPTTATLWHFSA